MSTTIQSIERHIINEVSDQTVIDCLFLSLQNSVTNISKQKLKLAMKYGAVWLTSKSRKTVRVSKAKKTLKKGDKLSIYYNEEILFSDIKPANLISDEGGYSVWDKPCGMFSQGSKWGNHTSITRWIELFGLDKNQLTQKPCFLVHRLDRATSGIILVAHSKGAAVKLSRLFENREIDKRYQAIVEGDISLEWQSKIITGDIDGKSAVSQILSVNYDSKRNQSSLSIKIETGRKHQIRKHLSSIGFPIIGDRLYGNKAIVVDNATETPDLMLKSIYLSFICPINKVKREYKI